MVAEMVAATKTPSPRPDLELRAALQVAIERMATARRRVVIGDYSPDQVTAKAAWADAHVAVLGAYTALRAAFLARDQDCATLPRMLIMYDYPPALPYPARMAPEERGQLAIR